MYWALTLYCKILYKSGLKFGGKFLKTAGPTTHYFTTPEFILQDQSLND